jgi:hypothetical protein
MPTSCLRKSSSAENARSGSMASLVCGYPAASHRGDHHSLRRTTHLGVRRRQALRGRHSDHQLAGAALYMAIRGRGVPTSDDPNLARSPPRKKDKPFRLFCHRCIPSLREFPFVSRIFYSFCRFCHEFLRHKKTLRGRGRRVSRSSNRDRPVACDGVLRQLTNV